MTNDIARALFRMWFLMWMDSRDPRDLAEAEAAYLVGWPRMTDAEADEFGAELVAAFED